MVMTSEDEAAVKLTAQYAAKPSVGASLRAAFKAATLNGHANPLAPTPVGAAVEPPARRLHTHSASSPGTGRRRR